jgi:ribosomal protein S18 acetylase RimI-like enzyme
MGGAVQVGRVTPCAPSFVPGSSGIQRTARPTNALKTWYVCAVMSLTIRAAEMNDAAALAELMCELGYETTKSEMQMRMERIGADERFRTFVAVLDGKVCGMIGTLTCPSYEHNDPGGRILALATLSTMRRCGIGSSLVATAEKDFAQRGIRRIALNTRLAREDAHKFYESLGYERNGWRFVKQLS